MARKWTYCVASCKRMHAISEMHTPLPIADANFFYIYQSDQWLAGPLYVDIGIYVIAKSQAEKQNVSVISY